MSHSAVILRFLNTSHYACVLYGYPGVDGTNGGGHSTGHASRTTDGYLGGCRCSQPRGVLVRPGQTASALVEGNAGHQSCAGRYRGLLVTPPNGYNSTPVSMAPYGCDLTVHPVVASRDGRG